VYCPDPDIDLAPSLFLCTDRSGGSKSAMHSGSRQVMHSGALSQKVVLKEKVPSLKVPVPEPHSIQNSPKHVSQQHASRRLS
jgi:hypothetical protein